MPLPQLQTLQVEFDFVQMRLTMTRGLTACILQSQNTMGRARGLYVNSSDSSQNDIFARAKSLEAKAGVHNHSSAVNLEADMDPKPLYSLYSQACVMHPGNNAPTPPSDVHVLTSLSSSKSMIPMLSGDCHSDQ